MDSELIFGVMASIDKPELSVRDLKYLTEPFSISESNLRTTLSRMAGRGIVVRRRVGRNVFYSRSKKGRAISSNVALRFNKPDWSNWNGLWWGVCFSISEMNKQYRYKIRKKLINCHFKPLYSGFWLRPYHSKQNIIESLKSDYLRESTRIIRFKPETDFSREFIGRLWDLEALNTGFENGIKLIGKHEEMSREGPQQAFVSMMQIGGQVVKILFSDPLLPDCYLPDNWKADTLRNAFGNFIKKSNKASKPFLEKIFRRTE